MPCACLGTVLGASKAGPLGLGGCTGPLALLAGLQALQQALIPPALLVCLT